MATLIGQSCCTLVAQALLVYFNLCAEMPVFYDCCGSWVWHNGKPEDWEETWKPAP
jgi:hypothetical protein